MPLPQSNRPPTRTLPRIRQVLLKEHLGITIIVILYLVLGVIYSVVTPIFEASDEVWHYPFVEHLAHGGSLPVQYPDQLGPWRQEGSQPPLYYALGALVTAWIDTDDMQQVRQINPHADMGIPMPDRNANMVIHTEQDGFPYTGTVLAVHVVRWLSVMMGAVTVVAGYGLARTVFPSDRAVSLSAAAFTAFNAMFLFITASVNNDALVIMLCALAIWAMARYVERSPSAWEWVGLGVLLGLASLSKVSALGLSALAAPLIAYRGWRERSWRRFFVGGLLVGLPMILIGGWWYYRNWRLYGDPVGLNAFVDIVGGRYPMPTLIQLLGEWKGFVMSYWGFFGGVNVPAPSWVYWVLSVLGLAGLVGVPIYIGRRWREDDLPLTRWMQIGFVALWPMIVFASLVRWTLMTVASQGRLMFSALTCLSLLMAMGLAAILPRRRAVAPLLAGVIMLVVAALLPWQTIAPAYAAPEILRVSDLAGLSPRCDATFGQSIRLLGYEIQSAPVLPGDDLAITFYWECLQPMKDNYSVFVHLLDTNDVMIAQRDMYPGQGNYPTSLWKQGDIFADTFVLNIPEVVLTPVDAQFEIGFYRLDDGTRLPVMNGTGQPSGDNLRFGRITIPRREENGIPNPVAIQLEEGIQLIGYDLDRTAALPGETLHLVLHWQAQQDVYANYSVFTHVLGDENRIWAQMDGWPLKGNAPTASWTQGQIIVDPYDLTLAEDTPPGLYELEVGMYDAEGRRLSVLGRGGFVQGDRIVLGAVRVLSVGASPN